MERNNEVLILHPYGFCPGCGSAGVSRSEGFDQCENNHRYGSHLATEKPSLLTRIKFSPEQHGGWPYILGPQVKLQTQGGPPPGSHQMILVSIVVQLLANGMPEGDIIKQAPWLEKEDIEACKLWWRNMVKLAYPQLEYVRSKAEPTDYEY